MRLQGLPRPLGHDHESWPPGPCPVTTELSGLMTRQGWWPGGCPPLPVGSAPERGVPLSGGSSCYAGADVPWRSGLIPPSDRIDPGDVLPAHRRCEATCDSRPEGGLVTAGADPPSMLVADCAGSPGAGRRECATGHDRRPGHRGAPRMGWLHSERGCGMPASRARTSVSRYRR